MTVLEHALLDDVEILAPGASLYGDNTYGEGVYGNGPAVNLTPFALHIRIRRGGTRDGLAIKTDVGLMTFTLKNAQDPLDDGHLEPGQILEAHSNGQPIFTGRIAHIDTSYPMDKTTGTSRALTTVTVADAVKIHATTPRYGVQTAEGYETFEDRIARLEGSADAPVDAPTTGQPRVVYAL